MMKVDAHAKREGGMRLWAFLACALALGAAAPSPAPPTVTPAGNPQSAPQAAPDSPEPDQRGKDGLTTYERESLAVDRAANRIGERANSIAEAQRVYGLIQLLLGGAGVFLTGFAGVWAWRAAHWAKEAARHAEVGAQAAADQLEAMRDVEAGALVAMQIANVEDGTLWIDFKNAGRSPLMTTEILYSLRDDLPPEPMSESDFYRKATHFVIVPDAHVGLIDVTGSLNFRHVLGFVRYADMYGREALLPFRFDKTNGKYWVAMGGEALRFAEKILSESDGSQARASDGLADQSGQSRQNS